MKTRAFKTGFTLIEMVLVVAIIAILVSMIVGVTRRFDNQGKERLCRGTITLLSVALGQFRDFGYEYKNTDYTGLVFPLDCNSYYAVNLETTLRDALYPGTTIIITPEPAHDPNFSGSEVLYFCLSKIPDCRATLDKIDKSLLTNKGNDKVTDIFITITSGATITNLPFTRIIDPWGTTLRYDYYPEYAAYMAVTAGGTWANYIIYRDSAKRTFPVITSAGPDKNFDTADDISNVK